MTDKDKEVPPAHIVKVVDHAGGRLVRRFNLWDQDGSGTIEQRDFDAEAARIVERFGETATSPRGSAVVGAFAQMWKQLATWAGVDSDGSLTLEQFVATVDQHMLEAGDQGFAALMRPTIQAIMGLIDTDGDGLVHPHEYTAWMAASGVDAATAEDAFHQLDARGAGQLTTGEIVNAVRDYYACTLDVSLLG